MKTLLWLDDIRNPHENDWLNFSPIGRNCNTVWVKSFDEFTSHITKNGLPDAICFDHDLGDVQAFKIGTEGIEEKTGYDCAKWLVDYCIDNNQKLPLFASQSANPTGRENILALLNNYNKYSLKNW